MRTLRKLFAAGTLLTAALVSIGADSLPQRQSPPAPTTQPATQPATQPSALPLYAGQKPDEWASYQALHAYTLDRFVRSAGFGVMRMPRDAPDKKPFYADGARYIVGRAQLISLNEGKRPFAYVTVFGDVMKYDTKDLEHAPLDATVLSALNELKAGKDVILARTGDDREFIGAIRATIACAQCHSVPIGTLLGAFRYPLVKEPTAQSRQISE